MSAPGQPENARVAARLDELAALLELEGSRGYAARAYRRAAALIRELPTPIAELVRSGRVRELRGIGPGIEARLRELVESGEIAEVEALRGSSGIELAALGRLYGFGATLGAAIGTSLEIRTLSELREALAAGRLREVHGIGPRTEARIAAALALAPQATAPGQRLDTTRELSARLAAALGGAVAGPVRRWKDEVDRIVVVVASDRPREVEERFAALSEIVLCLEPRLGLDAGGVPIELVVAPPSGAGTALVRATGASEWVGALEPLPEAPDEATLFARLGLAVVPPELREAGAAAPGAELLELGQIRGDLHVHTTWSDGRATVVGMAEAAATRGYEYLAICDHTPSVGAVPGLDAAALRRQGEEIDEFNARGGPLRVLRGVECDIRPDGSLDLPDEALAGLDWVQLSLHAGQRARRAELTARVTEAMRHPAVRCLSHPTGRLIGHRPENALDLEATIETALAHGVALEVNGLPSRLDLKGEHVRLALEAGVPIVCASDAHSTAGLDSMVFAVHTARRGGAGHPHVLNTQPLERVLHRAR